MSNSRPVHQMNSINFEYETSNINISYEPKVGSHVFEAMPNYHHPGHPIFDLRDTSNMTPDEIRSLANSIDQRVLQGAPKELLDAIEAGEISHIFRTENKMPVDPNVGKVGSIYFRKKTGETSRWKLPELAQWSADFKGVPVTDAGWDANHNGDVFSVRTAYFDNPDDMKAVQDTIAHHKSIVRGNKDPQKMGLGDSFDPSSIDAEDAIRAGKSDAPILVMKNPPASGSGSGSVTPVQAASTPPPGPDPAAPVQPPAQDAPTPTPSPDPTGPVNAPDPADVGGPAQPKPAAPSMPGTPAGNVSTAVKGSGGGVASGGGQPASGPAPSRGSAGGGQVSPKAQVTSNAPPSSPPPPSGGAPGASGNIVSRQRVFGTGGSGGRTTGQMMASAGDVARKVLGGKKGASALKVAGAGLLLGVGAQKVMGNRQPMSEEDIMRLEMQRRGM